jgi:hypothetical protein
VDKAEVNILCEELSALIELEASLNLDALGRAQWVAGVKGRRGYARTAVALAAKNARILWALLTKGDRFAAVPA